MNGQHASAKSPKTETDAVAERNGDGDSEQTTDIEIAKIQETTRNHSFQLVRLQSQIQELEKERTQDAEIKAELKQHLKDCYSTIAELKGRVAKLALEFYSSRPEAMRRPQNATTLLAPIRQEFSYEQHRTWICGEEDTAVKKYDEPKEIEEVKENVNDKSPPSFWSQVSDASQAAEMVADQLLQEQRPLLIEGLKSLVKVQQALVVSDANKPSSSVLEAFASLSLNESVKTGDCRPGIAKLHTNGNELQNSGIFL